MLSKNQIKEIQSLQLKKIRDTKKLFIAEGVKTVSEILNDHAILLKEIYGTHDFIGPRMSDLLRLNIPFTEVSEEELKKISLQTNPNSVLAVCHYIKEPQLLFDFEKNFSLYLDDVRDPGNLGTIIRLADWFGISSIFVSEATCDFYNPKVIQSTMGAFLRVKVITSSLDMLIEKHQVKTIYGAVLNGNNLYAETLRKGLIVIGNEANGISEANLKRITHAITIPSNQQNGTESLNAAMAASIITSEFFRQLSK